MSRTIAAAGKGGTGKTTVAALLIQLEAFIRESGLELAGLIPEDSTVADYDTLGKPLVDLPKGSPIRCAMENIVKNLDGLV